MDFRCVGCKTPLTFEDCVFVQNDWDYLSDAASAACESCAAKGVLTMLDKRKRKPRRSRTALTSKRRRASK